MDGRPATDLAEPERVMNCALRLGRVVTLDYHRDVQLTRALRDRDDVDFLIRQCAEQPRRNTRRAGHAESNHCNRRQIRTDVYRIDLVARQLGGEGFA